METNCSISTKHITPDQENTKVKKKKTTHNSKPLTPEEKAEKLRLQRRLSLLNETPEQREARLQRARAWKQSRTPEQREAYLLKKASYQRKYRENQINTGSTPQEREALLQKRKEYSKQYREQIRSKAKTAEEREALRVKLLNEKRKSVEKLSKLPNRDSCGRLCTDEEKKVKTRRVKNDEEVNLSILKKRWQATNYMRGYRRRKKAALEEANISDTSDRMEEEFQYVLDHIKIEDDIFIETKYSLSPNEDSFSGSLSSSYLEPFVTSSTGYHYNSSSSLSNLPTKIPRGEIHESTNNTTVKCEEFEIFGEHYS